MTNRILLLAASLSLASAHGEEYGFGSPSDTTLHEANQNPNVTASVPFEIGDQNFTLRVNVAEFTPTSADTSVENPRMAASFYELEWSGNSSVNDTVRAAESLGNATIPRLCAAIPLGFYSASVVNGYSDNDDGDCSGALGKDCVNDLKEMSYDLAIPCRLDTPKSCEGKLADGGIGSSCRSLW